MAESLQDQHAPASEATGGKRIAGGLSLRLVQELEGHEDRCSMSPQFSPLGSSTMELENLSII